MADKTVNEGLLETVKELRETNKRLASASSSNPLYAKQGWW